MGTRKRQKQYKPRKHSERKGQSAMEYLMTYGWAILIVIIVAAVLYQLGIFNPSTYTTTAAVGFPNFNVPSGGFQLSSAGILTMQLTNGVGATINITYIGANVGSSINESTITADAGLAVGPGQTTTLTFSNLGSRNTGSSYNAKVNVTYTNADSGLAGFVSSGTLSGTVS